MRTFRETWIEQCTAAEDLRERFGVDKGIGYLVGEKFLNALRHARVQPDMAEEIPAFAARIRNIFGQHELVAWFTSVRRLGALGHIATDEEHRAYLAAGAIDEDVVRGGEDVLALERARELLIVD